MPIRTYHLIPHTHWDREWYLTRAAFVCRLVPALDDLVARLESDPGFRAFLLDGQTVHLGDYLGVRPDMEPRVRALVTRGRLQVGPWYVLADELIPSGESLVRNLLAGRADAGRFGARLDVLYSPDAFGHPAIWPALGAEFGIGWGVLWRGLGGEPVQDGDLFRWRAPDGGEVLLHHLSPDGYEAGAALPADAAKLEQAWPALKAQLAPRARSPHLAVFVGADHHAAHPAVGRLRDLLAALEPEAEVRVSRLDEYFAAAEAEAGHVPVLEGELRWSYGYTWTLQGVHATRAPLKRLHAESELSLERMAEPLAALALWYRGVDRRPLLAHAWRTLLRSQFHDSIAGCTSDAVAERVALRLGDALTMAGELARASLDALTGNDPDVARDRPDRSSPALVFFNPAARARSAVVVTELSWFRRDVLVGPPGQRVPRRRDPPSDREIAAALAGLPHQVLARRAGAERLDSARHYPDQDEVELVRVALATPELGGFGLIRGGRADPPATPVRVGRRRMENGLLEVALDPEGLVRVTDLRTGARHERLLGLESEGDAGDTYSFAPMPGEDLHRATWSALRTAAPGPLVGALELRSSLRSDAVRARLMLSLYAGSPLLRLTIDLENGAGDHRLRLRIPGGARGGIGTTRAGSPFGALWRETLRIDPGKYPRETPVATAPAHRFVAAVGEHALAVLAPGFFEYELEPGGDLLVTLLRCVGQLSREDLPTRPGNAGWPVATPGAQCICRERIQLALAPVRESDLELVAPLASLWEDAFLPPRAIWLRQATELSPPAIEVRLEGAGLVFSSLKPAEAGGRRLAFRCYNATGAEVEGRLRLSAPVDTVERVRADEQEPSPLRLDEARTSVRFTAGPHAIVTLLLTPT
ncbi:MAG TPA: glycosyl hydrolase-related protein [Gemmatimonadales bacterium]|nr:glycosyl hydrolase-related protein [Gemmatimonadales bacterium]